MPLTEGWSSTTCAALGASSCPGWPCAATAPTASSAPLAAGAVVGVVEAAAVEVAEVRLPRRRRRPRRHRRRRRAQGGSACRPDFIPAIPTLGVTATATGRPPSAPLNTAPRTASAGPGAAVAASPNPRPPPGAATRAPPSQLRWRSPPWLGSPSTAGAAGRARRATLPTSRAALKRREPVNAVNLPSTCRRPPLRATGRDLRSLARARSDSR